MGGVVVVDALGGEDREEADDARAAPRSGGRARARPRGAAWAARAWAMRSSSCWSRSLSSSSSSSSLEAKWCSSPGSLIPTRLAMVASDAPRKPRVAKTSLAAAEDRVATLATLRVPAPLPARGAHGAGAWPRGRAYRWSWRPSSKLCALGQVARRAADRTACSGRRRRPGGARARRSTPGRRGRDGRRRPRCGPGPSWTFSYPLSWRGGSPADRGKDR